MALVYPANLQELVDEGAGSILFSLFDRPNSQSSNFIEVIHLYMPNDLRNPMNINWEQKELGAVGGNVVQDDSIAKGIFTSALSNLLDFAKAKDVLEIATGTIANPYMSMAFKSLGFRKFKMEFKFTPHNSGESSTIDGIIKAFRRIALPTGGKKQAVFGYPGEISIRYVGNCTQWLPLFKRSVITDVDVNYSGQGFYAGMEDGFPAETVMTLEFVENELIFRDDIMDGASY